jgi:hypothetical protein
MVQFPPEKENSAPAARISAACLVPPHRGFDCLIRGYQDGQILGCNENLDAARDTGLAADEAFSFEGENHLVDRGRGYPEVPLHLAFGGWLPMHSGVSIDEG